MNRKVKKPSRENRLPKLIVISVVFALSIFLTGLVLIKNEQNVVSVKPSSKVLTNEEYRSLDDKFAKIVENESPVEALNLLSKLMTTDKRVLKECHGFTHLIGHAAIDKYADIATVLGFQDDVCGSGYIHGIIEDYLGKSKDVFSDMHNLCLQYGLGAQAG